MRDNQRKKIEDLVDILTQHHLTELEIEEQGIRIRVKRESASLASSLVPPPMVSIDQPLLPAHSQELGSDTSRFVTVKSPIVGTFYRSASPDADPYVQEGHFVKKGQILCIIEAMKLMNEIESETEGKMVKVLVESASSVEFGEPLFLIDPIPAS